MLASNRRYVFDLNTKLFIIFVRDSYIKLTLLSLSTDKCETVHSVCKNKRAVWNVSVLIRQRHRIKGLIMSNKKIE